MIRPYKLTTELERAFAAMSPPARLFTHLRLHRAILAAANTDAAINRLRTQYECDDHLIDYVTANQLSSLKAKLRQQTARIHRITQDVLSKYGNRT